MSSFAKFGRRALGAGARRLQRPELLAAFDSSVRQAQAEDIGIKALLAGTLARGSTYVDVGANRGQVLRDATRVAPTGAHIAFEPIPELAAEMRVRFPEVDCRCMAVGAGEGIASFCHFRELDGWSGLRRSPEISDERGRPEYLEVQVSTLDAELSGLTPRVIKIDVEGGELAVLQGARSVLTRARPHLIIEHVAAASELYEVSSEELWDLLSELDYAIFAVTGEGPYTRAAFATARSVVNWLATPNSVTQTASS